jgi:hypothetical protein
LRPVCNQNHEVTRQRYRSRRDPARRSGWPLGPSRVSSRTAEGRQGTSQAFADFRETRGVTPWQDSKCPCPSRSARGPSPRFADSG